MVWWALPSLPFGQFMPQAFTFRSFPRLPVYSMLGISCGRHPDVMTLATQSARRTLALVAAVLVFGTIISLNWLWGIQQYGNFYKIPTLDMTVQWVAGPGMRVSAILVLYRLATYVSARGGVVAAVARQLGEYGFGIYLIHPFVLTLLGLWGANLGLGYGNWQRYPVFFLATLVLSYILARLLGMLPLGTWIVGKQPARRRVPPMREPETAPTVLLRTGETM